MTEQQILNRINERAMELLSIPAVSKIYHSKKSEEIAKNWILNQALITLMYSPEERERLSKN